MPTLLTAYRPTVAKLDPLYPNDGAQLVDVRLLTGTYARGTVLGELTAEPAVYGPYAALHVDGTQKARLILAYACVVDSSGAVTLEGAAGAAEIDVPAYMGGGSVFNTSELVGLDASAVVDLGASLIQGTVSNGQLRF